jgi:hypothetical protein
LGVYVHAIDVVQQDAFPFRRGQTIISTLRLVDRWVLACAPLCFIVIGIPVAMPVEKILIRAEEK